jgi:opacity protein-like surface antigen
MKLFLAAAALAAVLSVPALADSSTEVLKGDVNATSQSPTGQTGTVGAGAKVKASGQMMKPGEVNGSAPGADIQDKTDTKANDKGK